MAEEIRPVARDSILVLAVFTPLTIAGANPLVRASTPPIAVPGLRRARVRC